MVAGAGSATHSTDIDGGKGSVGIVCCDRSTHCRLSERRDGCTGYRRKEGRSDGQYGGERMEGALAGLPWPLSWTASHAITSPQHSLADRGWLAGARHLDLFFGLHSDTRHAERSAAQPVFSATRASLALSKWPERRVQTKKNPPLNLSLHRASPPFALPAA